MKHIFKRKIYDRLKAWKERSAGSTAILIEGARRVGKSTIAKEFARNEYDSYILVDFSDLTPQREAIFENIADRDMFFTQLQLEYGVRLQKRKSVIIFDEIQFAPRVRQAIKHLVADGRFDYIETGSLISIHKNVKDIMIPSEEESVNMYPMDYEEFQWAMGRDMRPALLREALKRRKPLGQVHRSLMQDFRLYMLVGGMPQAVSEYLDSQNLESVDEVKRGIIRLYDNDFDRIDDSHRLARLFDAIPGQLARNVSRYMPRNVVGPLAAATQDRFISEMGASMTVNICNHILDPANGVSMGHNMDCFKMYLGDTGLFVTLAFKGKDFTENTIYQKLLTDKLPANLGYLYENIVAQMLRASGYELFYYTFPSDSKHLYEVDFLLADRDKVDPIEVKSSSYKTHASLDAFCRKYSGKIGTPIVVNTKDMTWENGILYIPPYFVPFLSEL